MSDEEFSGLQNIRDLFEKVLGTEVTIKDEIDDSEEKIFVNLIKKLDQAFTKENKIEEISGIDLTKVTEDLWYVVEHLMQFTYGDDARELIMWYVLFRGGDDKEGIWQDDEGKVYKIDTPQKLWKHIKKREDKK